jgi:hypothetical protein
VGYNKRGFFPLRDITKEFFRLWDTIEKVFLRCGIQQRKILRWQTNFFLLYPTTQEIFLPLYPTPQQNLIQCTVSQKNLPHCIPQRRRFSSVIPQWKIFSSIMRYNGRGFLSLWDTTEEAFRHCGIQRMRFFSILGYYGRSFFPLQDAMEKK